jgi:FkbM family methyltransferase
MKIEKLTPSNPSNWLDLLLSECQSYPIQNIDFNKNSILVDAGSNVGAFTITWGQKFNKIICIEASKSNYESLINNTQDLKEKITYINKAVSYDDNLNLKLMKYTHENGEDTNSGNYGIIHFVNESNNHGWKENTGYEEVVSISIDEILKISGGKIDLLKVDVEGSEYDFLFEKDLSNIEYITMELHNFLNSMGKQLPLIEHILKTHNEIYSEGDGINTHMIKLWKKK